PVNIKKIKNIFEKIPYNFNFYFVQITDPDYDSVLQKGITRPEEINDLFGSKIMDTLRSNNYENSINVIFTNNMSDEHYVPMRSAWMLGHRMAHTLIGGYDGTSLMQSTQQDFEDMIRDIAVKGYDVEWPEEQYYQGVNMYDDYLYAYGKVLGKYFGTMKAARSDRIVNHLEWLYETFVQYLLTGTITFNDPPSEIHQHDKLVDKNAIMEILNSYKKRLIKKFIRILNKSVGNIYVM
ncbi:MAG: hypothetical protein WC284_17355, partial [Candidimonas sp.]